MRDKLQMQNKTQQEKKRNKQKPNKMIENN